MSGPYRWMLLGVAVFVVATTGLRVWHERAEAEELALVRAETTADVVAESAARLLDAGAFMLLRASDRVAARDWADITGSRALWDDLKAEQAFFPFVRAIWLFDAEGRGQLTTLKWPPPEVDARDRDYFLVHRTDDTQGTYVSQPMVGRATGRHTFVLSRRLEAADGTFRGVVATSVETGYLQDFVDKFRLDASLRPHLALMHRRDGAVLYSAAEGHAGGQSAAPLPAGLAGVVETGTYGRVIDGDTYAAWRRVEHWPVAAVVGFGRGPVLEAWIRDSTPPAILALLALLGLGGFAFSLKRAERRAPPSPWEEDGDLSDLPVLSRNRPKAPSRHDP